jgi:hypothetical protein
MEKCLTEISAVWAYNPGSEIWNVLGDRRGGYASLAFFFPLAQIPANDRRRWSPPQKRGTGDKGTLGASACPIYMSNLLKQPGSREVYADAAADHVESLHGLDRCVERAIRGLQLTRGDAPGDLGGLVITAKGPGR